MIDYVDGITQNIPTEIWELLNVVHSYKKLMQY